MLVTVGNDSAQTWDLQPATTIAGPKVPFRVVRFAFGADGEYLLVGNDESLEVLRASASGGLDVKRVLRTSGPNLTAVAVSRDGAFVAAAYGDRVDLWDGNPQPRTFSSPVGEVSSLAFSFDPTPDHELLALAGKSGGSVLPVRASGTKAVSLPDDGVPVKQIAFSRDGEFVVTVSNKTRMIPRSQFAPVAEIKQRVLNRLKSVSAAERSRCK